MNVEKEISEACPSTSTAKSSNLRPTTLLISVIERENFLILRESMNEEWKVEHYLRLMPKENNLQTLILKLKRLLVYNVNSHKLQRKALARCIRRVLSCYKISNKTIYDVLYQMSINKFKIQRKLLNSLILASFKVDVDKISFQNIRIKKKAKKKHEKK